MNIEAPKNKVIKIAPGRAHELDELRKLIDVDSYSDLIGKLIDLARTTYPLAREVPGVMVNRIPEGVQIFFDGQRAHGVTVSGAHALAKAIRDYVGSPAGAKTPTHDQANNFLVKGNAQAVFIAVPANAKGINYTVELSKKFADLLERTANSAPRAANS